MRTGLIATLRRIYGPPYRGLIFFLLGLMVLSSLGPLLNFYEWAFPPNSVEWEIESVAEMLDSGWFLLTYHVQRSIAWPRDLLFHQFSFSLLLLPLAVPLGLLALWRSSIAAVKVWAAFWALSGALGIYWLVVAIGGSYPGALPFILEPYLWAAGVAIVMLALISLVRPGPRISFPARRLPALTVIAFFVGHLYFYWPIHSWTYLVFELPESYRIVDSFADVIAADRGRVIAWTTAICSLPGVLVFLAVALRDLSISGAVAALFRVLRLNAGAFVTGLLAIVLMVALSRILLGIPWLLHALVSETPTGRLVIGTIVFELEAVERGLFLYFVIRAVWVLTDFDGALAPGTGSLSSHPRRPRRQRAGG